MPGRASSASWPMPDSISSCGELIEPPLRSTSRGPVADCLAPAGTGHAGRARAFEQDALDHDAGVHGEIGPRLRGIEVGHRGRAARAVALGDLVQADAKLRGPVEVVVARQAGLLACIDEDP